jgi:hypothetical protein
MNARMLLARCAAAGALGALFALGAHGAEPPCGPTKHLRMPLMEWQAAKRQKLDAAGLTWAEGKDYELDHIIPLCLGGSNAPDNLQLQPWFNARKKDYIERETCQSYCAGRISLDAARARFRRDR